MSADEISKIRYSAMGYLAMREHSKKELLTKLLQKYPKELVMICLDDFEAQGLQSDDRFADAFVRMRQRQGKGPRLIQMELKQKGLSGAIISSYFADQEVWNQLALMVRTKKFGSITVNDPKEKAKQMRFLASRGFNSVNIHFALTSNN